MYAKPPFGGPEQVLKYLARYTHRVAISNQRLVKLEEGRVTFRYKDYADSRREKRLTLSAEEFLRRFVQHVLPKGFVKIRHYGLLASRQRQARLEQARHLLQAQRLEAALQPGQPVQAEAAIDPPAEPWRCPACGGQRRSRMELPRADGPPGGAAPEPSPAALRDTS